MKKDRPLSFPSRGGKSGRRLTERIGIEYRPGSGRVLLGWNFVDVAPGSYRATLFATRVSEWVRMPLRQNPMWLRGVMLLTKSTRVVNEGCTTRWPMWLRGVMASAICPLAVCRPLLVAPATGVAPGGHMGRSNSQHPLEAPTGCPSVALRVLLRGFRGPALLTQPPISRLSFRVVIFKPLTD